jgi:hypothetical protein
MNIDPMNGRDRDKPFIKKDGCCGWVVYVWGHPVYGWSQNRNHRTFQEAVEYTKNPVCYFGSGKGTRPPDQPAY